MGSKQQEGSQSMRWGFQRMRWWCHVGLWAVLSSGLWMAPGQAAEPGTEGDPEVRALQQRLVADQAALVSAETQLQQLKQERETLLTDLDLKAIDAAMVSRLELAVSTAKLAYENAKIELNSARQAEVAVEHQIHDLDVQLKAQVLNRASRSPQNRDLEEELTSKLQSKRAIATLIKNRVGILKTTVSKYEEMVVVQDAWYRKIKGLRDIQLATTQEAQHQELETRLKREEDFWQRKASDLRQRLAQADSQASTETLKQQIFEAEERGALTSITLGVLRQQARSVELNMRLEQAQGNTQALRTVLESLKQMQEELRKTHKIIEGKLEILAGWRELYQKGKENKTLAASVYKNRTDLIDELWMGYQTQKKTISHLLGGVKKNITKSQKAYSQGLSTRQPLPSSWAEWSALLRGFAELPKMIWQSVALLGYRIADLTHESGQWVGASVVVLGLAWITSIWGQIQLRRSVPYWAQRVSRSARFLPRALWFGGALLGRNLAGYTALLLFMVFLWGWNISFTTYGVFVWMVWIGLVLKTLLDANRLLLLDRTGDETGHDLHVYKILRTALGVGGGLTIGVGLGHLLNLPPEQVAFIDRLFMLFLLAVSYVLFKNRHVFPALIPGFESRARYLQHTVRVFAVLLPLVICSNALMGLLGYVNLSWRMGMAEGQFLAVFIVWMLLRGLLGDLMASVYEYCIRYVQNGWLWTESVLKPFQRILEILLFALAVCVFLWLGGWGKETAVWDTLYALFFQPFFYVRTYPVSLSHIVQCGLMASIVVWAGKWSREFSYRWFFSGVKDLGIRHSLSVFAQYMSVAIGVYLLLIILGIDVTTLAVAGGALLVGIGFGLQNIANNLMSGILLLLERPVRTGDIVSIGNFEGEVTRIGIRSMSVKTWDYFEVIIPNAETIGHPFMNWTHHDNIVRTVFPVRVDFHDDPLHVHQLIENVLKENPDILEEPPPEVLLVEFGESHLRFEVRYFIDLGTARSRPRVQSAVMFRILAVLKDAGIQLPYPRRHIHVDQAGLKNLPALE